MKALINTKRTVQLPDNKSGYLIAQFSEEEFDVHPDLFWVDCEEYILEGNYCWMSGEFQLIPPPDTEEI